MLLHRTLRKEPRAVDSNQRPGEEIAWRERRTHTVSSSWLIFCYPTTHNTPIGEREHRVTLALVIFAAATKTERKGESANGSKLVLAWASPSLSHPPAKIAQSLSLSKPLVMPALTLIASLSPIEGGYSCNENGTCSPVLSQKRLTVLREKGGPRLPASRRTSAEQPTC